MGQSVMNVIDRRTMIAAAMAMAMSGCDRNTPKRARAKPASPELMTAGEAADPRGLVELILLDPSIRLDIRYATAQNFTGRRLYSQARAFLVAPAAKALEQAHRAVQHEDFGLTIYDAYRPWRITKALWDATPAGPKRNYVANPKRGSKHNRGCAIDVTLHHLADGAEVAMPSGYDEFTTRAHRNYTGATVDALHHRALLQKVLEDAGFRGASNEWWHFDFNGWQDYPLLDVPFEELG